MGSAKNTPDNASLIEPTRLAEVPEAIADSLANLSAASTRLGFALHPITVANLATVVRIIDACHDNRIEGHDIGPDAIDGALAGDLDPDDAHRTHQLEAAAYVPVRADIDRMAAEETLPEPASRDFLQALHHDLYRDAPEAALPLPGGTAALVTRPGDWRHGRERDAAVDRPGALPADQIDPLMQCFEARYRFVDRGTAARILAIASAHHRLDAVRPFRDGNGRVGRLMSHAMTLKAGIGAGGLWSISRGLAQGLETPAEYRQMMDYAATPRQGDEDGPGDPSQRALTVFTLWFLKVCLGQVATMSALFDREALAVRLGAFVERSGELKPQAAHLLEAALIRGQFDRGEAARITDLPERSARRLLNDVTAAGLLASATPKGPVSLRFPVAAWGDLFPGLDGGA
ncbi:MAG: Fic family protein [bacterium]|nr:Fic family protein [bacterium]